MKGFTLIEVLVVAAITVIMTGLLIANFSRTRVDINQTVLLVKDAIREAQSLALSGAVLGRGPSGTSRCGYGIHFEASRYVIYPGPVSDTPGNCVQQNYGYSTASGVVSEGLISNTVLTIEPLPPDIFFESPDPTTYFIGGAGNVATVTIRRKGTTVCPSVDCRQINVTLSGQIQ